MKPMYVEGLNTGFMWPAAYPGLSFHENRRYCLFFAKNIFLVFSCFIISCSFFVFAYSLTTAENSHQFVNYLYSGSAYVVCGCRALLFYMKRNQIRECLEILKTNFLKSVNYSIIEYRKIYNLGIKKCNTIYFLWTLLLYGLLVLWISSSLFPYIIDNFLNSESHMPGSYNVMYIAYPFNTDYSPTFELILVFEFVLILLTLEMMRFTELTFLYIVSMTCTQISIITLSLGSIKYRKENNRSQELQLTAYRRLIDCIQDHQKLIR